VLNLLVVLYAASRGIDGALLSLLIVVVVALELAPVPVVLAHALARLGLARLLRLRIRPPQLRVFVRLDGPGRTGARLGVAVAGTAAAYLAVAALAFAFATCHGLETGRAYVVIDGVLDGYDAAGKLRPGDRLLLVDGEPLLAGVSPSLTERVAARAGAPMTLTVRREGAVLDVEVQPRLRPPRAGEAGSPPVWLLGVLPRRDPELVTDAAVAAELALRLPFEHVRSLPRDLLDEGTAAISTIFGTRDRPDPGGPVRIVEEYRRQLAFGDLFWSAWLSALPAASFALLVLAILDLMGAVALVRARRRYRPAA
jgi:hypothetical protein